MIRWDSTTVTRAQARHVHPDAAFRRPMALPRDRDPRWLVLAEQLVLLVGHVLLIGGAIGALLFALWLSAPGGR